MQLEPFPLVFFPSLSLCLLLVVVTKEQEIASSSLLFSNFNFSSGSLKWREISWVSTQKNLLLWWRRRCTFMASKTLACFNFCVFVLKFLYLNALLQNFTPCQLRLGFFFSFLIINRNISNTLPHAVGDVIFSHRRTHPFIIGYF